MLLDGEIVEELGLIGYESEKPLRLQGLGGEVVTGNRYLASIRPEGAGQDEQGGGLSGSVGANQPDHFTGGHAKTEARNGDLGAKRLCQPGYLQHR